jgi:diguanylate cyclase
MLWNRRKPAEPAPTEEPAPTTVERASVRSADSDRALDAVGTLLKAYGRFAFDTERAASSVREQCEHWAQRIALGEPRQPDQARGPGLLRDWPGLQRFFDEQRRHESEFVARSLGGLRGTVLTMARFLGGGAGEDRDSDAHVELCLQALSRALGTGDMPGVSRAAAVVIESAREAMARRRSREARQLSELSQQLRQLREDLAEGLKNAVVDPVTGLLGRAPYEQQLEQLCSLGALLEQRPWLAVVEVKPGRGSTADDAALCEVAKVVTRTFLRKQDFVARSGAREFALLIADMTEEQLVAALERLLAGVRKLSEARRHAPSVVIGVACCRASDEAEGWRARADLALTRAKEDGGDGYQLLR